MAPKLYRSYTASFKLSVNSHAEQIENKAAAQEFEVNKECIQHWRQKLENILQKRIVVA